MLTLILAVIVAAQLDSTELIIGAQTDLKLSAVTQNDEQVYFPVYGEYIIPDIEIVNRTAVDTTTLKDGSRQLSQTLTITCFRDSLFFIPPLPFTNTNGDTILSDPLTLNVIQPFVIDTTQNAITDIKPVFKAPVYWWGIIRWILLAIALIALAIGAYFLYQYLKHKFTNNAPQQEPDIPLRPAEEVALEKLDQLKENKIWQQGRHKEYHTILTDVIREYIARRFSISSQEQTSTQILHDIQPALKNNTQLFGTLKQMLSLADLVKFAKFNPLPEENEQSLLSAYNFVRQTTPNEPEQQTTPNNPEQQ